MLEDKDIQKLEEILATKRDLEGFAAKDNLDERTNKLLKEVFSTKEDLGVFKKEVSKSFSELHSAIDAYGKKVDD